MKASLNLIMDLQFYLIPPESSEPVRMELDFTHLIPGCVGAVLVFKDEAAAKVFHPTAPIIDIDLPKTLPEPPTNNRSVFPPPSIN